MPSRSHKRRFPGLRPRSIRGLLLAGYVVVAIPLVAATVFAIVYVDRLTEQSERLIKEGVQVTRLSQQLRTDITAMERTARQYAVLDDPDLKKRFDDHRQSFKRTLDKIDALGISQPPNWDLKALRARADQVADALAAQPDGETRTSKRRARFSRMHELARMIGNQGNAFIDSEMARIQSTSREVRLFLILAAIALIPATLALVGLFTIVISRPIRQIDRAVRRLGSGDFAEPVAISAPSAELDALGEQLDWMRRRLEALESEKNQFLRHMSHELKTPLASIREGAKLLRDGTLQSGSHEESEVIDILHRNSQELTILIENLLDFAAWKQQHAQVATKALDLREMASRVAARHQLSTEARDLHIELPREGVTIQADRDRLRLILDNLIANAVKFSPDGGTIRIAGAESVDGTTVEISDEGPGIEPGEREHVFAAFHQAHPDAGAHVRGTGIGLSVVREGVHAHGGSIQIVDSETGACFRIVIPDGDAP